MSNDDYDSKLRSTDTTTDTLIFAHAEAEKKIIEIDKSLERIRDKAKHFLSLIIIFVSGLLAILGYGIKTNSINVHFSFNELVIILYYLFCSLCMLAISANNCLIIMGEDTNRGCIGREPENCIDASLLNQVEKENHYNYSLLKTTEHSQDVINHNFKEMLNKQKSLNVAFQSLTAGLFLAYASIIISFVLYLL
jgi:hypothetical protein